MQAVQAPPGERPEGVADGLDAAAQGGGDLGGSPALIALEQNLAATQRKRMGGAEALTKGGPLGFGQGPNEQRGFHAPLYAADDSCTGCRL